MVLPYAISFWVLLGILHLLGGAAFTSSPFNVVLLHPTPSFRLWCFHFYLFWVMVRLFSCFRCCSTFFYVQFFLPRHCIFDFFLLLKCLLRPACQVRHIKTESPPLGKGGVGGGGHGRRVGIESVPSSEADGLRITVHKPLRDITHIARTPGDVMTAVGILCETTIHNL